MNSALRVTQVGNSLGVVLPKELVSKLKVVKGDSLFVTETPSGYTLTANDPTFADQMTKAREIMKRRRQVLHVLAQ